MHPEARKRRLLGEVFRLRDLAGVVREGKVHASTVNVDLRSQVAHGHRAALDMPAGTTWSPGTGPRGFAGCLSLPEHKIQRISFTRIFRKVPALVGNGQHG